MLDAITGAVFWEPTPDMEPVTLLSQQSGKQGTFLSWLLPYARRKNLRREERLARGLLGVRVVIWEIWQNSLTQGVAQGDALGPTPEPKINDRIGAASDGTTWRVLDLDASFVSGGVPLRWELTCQLSVSG